MEKEFVANLTLRLMRGNTTGLWVDLMRSEAAVDPNPLGFLPRSW